MKIVLLLGPSSAGKSTTCAALHDHYGWRVSSGDVVNNNVLEGIARTALEEKDLFKKLQNVMTEQQIIALCVHNILEITQGEHKVSHQFYRSTYSDFEKCLLDAGFSESEEKEFSSLLHEVDQVRIDFENKNIHIDFDGELLNDAFNSGIPDETVVIDHIPIPDGGAEEFVARFEERVKQYQAQHGEDSIQSCVILACCPPQQLSDRILTRNREAEESGDLNNRRRGPFPFDQLSALVHVGLFQSSKQNRVGEISRDDLAGIAAKHPWPEWRKQTDFSSEEVARSMTDLVIGSVFNYADLSEKYGMESHKAMQDLVVRPAFEAYPRINTAEGSPQELSEKVVEIMQSNNTFRLRM